MTTTTSHGYIKSVATEHFDTRSAPNGEFVIRGYASKPVIDRYNEIVDVAAFTDTIEPFNLNPICLNQHDPRQPIGRFRHLELRNDGLFVEAVIGHGFEPAETVRRQIEQKITKCFSIGFKETTRGVVDKSGVYHIVGLELLEISTVAIPACAPAIFEHDGTGKLLSIRTLHDDRRATPTIAAMRKQLAALLVDLARREHARAECRHDAALQRLRDMIAALESKIVIREMLP